MKYSIGDLVEITKNIFGRGERWQSPVGKLGTIVNIESEEERYEDDDEDDNDLDCIECNNYDSVDTSLFNNTRFYFEVEFPNDNAYENYDYKLWFDEGDFRQIHKRQFVYRREEDGA